jgi:hypothetical protein
VSACNVYFGAELLTALALSNSIMRAAMIRIGTLPAAALALMTYNHTATQAHRDYVVDALVDLNHVLASDFPETWYRIDTWAPTYPTVSRGEWEHDARFLLDCTR